MAELADVRRRLEEGRRDPGEVEDLMARAKQVLEAGREVLRRAEAAVKALELGR